MNYYELLQISPRASAEEVDQAYRRLARKLHPDLNPGDPHGATGRMRELNKIREILTDPEQRARYDEKLAGASDEYRADFFTPVYNGKEKYPGNSSRNRERYPMTVKENSRVLVMVLFAAAICLGILLGYWFHQNQRPVVTPMPAVESTPTNVKEHGSLPVKPDLEHGRKDISSVPLPPAQTKRAEVIGPGSTRAEVLKVLGPPKSSKVDPYSNEETLDFGSLQLVLRDGRVRYGTTSK
jgi:curved DNA-binding protein CbpA